MEGAVRRTKDVDVMLGDPKKAIVALAVPMVIAILITQANIFADTFWCAGLGTEALATISITASLYYLIHGVGNGVGIGASAAISRKIAKDDKEGADGCAGQTLLAGVILSLIVTPVMLVFTRPVLTMMGAQGIMEECVNYVTPYFLFASLIIFNGLIAGLLRSEGAAKKSMVMLVLSAVLNIILDPIFIYTMGMGLAGAAWATVVSILISNALGLYWYMSKKMYVDLRFRNLRYNKNRMSDVMVVGGPQAIELNVMSFMNLILNYFVITCGGTDGFAAYGTPWRFVMLLLVPCMAIAGAIVPVCAAALSRDDYAKARLAYNHSLKLALSITMVFVVITAIFAFDMVSVFTYYEESGHLQGEMARALRIYMIFVPFFVLIPIGSSLFQSMRMGKKSLVSAFIRNVLLVVLYSMAYTVSMDAIYFSLVAGEIIGGSLMYLWSRASFRSEEKRYLATVSEA